MSVKDFVDNVLCVPVTRIGNKYIIEAIEFVLDTREYKFYSQLSELHKTSTRYLEKAMRDSKSLGLSYMATSEKESIFGKAGGDISVSEYILKAAEYYRRVYENKS